MEKARYVTAAESRAIAEQVGQYIADEIVKQHNEHMETYTKDFQLTRNVLSMGLLDVRRKSVGYILRTAWQMDVVRFRGWLATVWQAIVSLLERYFDFEFASPVDEIEPQPDAETAEKGGKIITEELPESPFENEPVAEEGHGQPLTD